MSRTAIMLGLVIGFLSLSLPSYENFEIVSDTADQEESNGEESSNKNETTVSSLNALIGSSLQFSFDHQSFLIHTLPDVEDQVKANSESQSTVLIFDKVLQILFRRLISPNAP